jgi:hypothetical protein
MTRIRRDWVAMIGSRTGLGALQLARYDEYAQIFCALKADACGDVA